MRRSGWLCMCAFRYRASVGSVNRPGAVRTVTSSSSRRHAVVVKVRRACSAVRRTTRHAAARAAFFAKLACAACIWGASATLKAVFEGCVPLPHMLNSI